jgi:hypothetical protein
LGHAFWTAEPLAATALRYPDLDLRPWRAGPRGGGDVGSSG